MSEEIIIKHCSPTLAGIKTGSMFSVGITENNDINKEVRELNNLLRKKGLRVIPLKKTKERALIYFYRPSHLRKDLNNPIASNILQRKGYKCENPDCCIAQLVKHLKNDDEFPHEIGLFLGYPPADVECFIKNPCDGVKCVGCFKAYSNPEKAKRLFKRYDDCTKAYCELNKKGKTLEELAVLQTLDMCDRKK